MSVRAESAGLAGLLARSAREHPERPVFHREGAPLAYAGLDAGAARLAGALRERGVGPGDRVAIQLQNGPGFAEAYYGALRLGAVAVPLNALLKEEEVDLRLGHAEAAALVAPAALAPLAARHGAALLEPEQAAGAAPVDELAPVAPEETAVILYTSGTTGNAKGAELTHAGLRATATGLAALLGAGPDDVVFGSAPFAHVFGMTGVLNMAVAVGASIALVQRFEADAALALISETGTTMFMGVPAMCIELLRAAERSQAPTRLRVAHVGGAPLPVETLHAFVERFGCPVLEGYGLSETGGTATTHRLGEPVKPGSVGRAIDGVELRIADDDGRELAPLEVGEVLVRGPGVMRGYRGDEETTRATLSAAGWLATGDVGYLDADGYLYLVDRKKDVILRGGYTVYPREVEEVLYRHPDVREAVVVGVPEPTLGEEVAALVVARGPGCEPDAVKAFAREHLAAYKYPRLVLVVEDLPHGPSGKIQRREIDRAALAARLPARPQ